VLTNLKIQGFRCFRDVDVPLKPLTVLIGPNDTGKSSFLDATLLLRRGDAKFDLRNVYRSGVNGELTVAARTANGNLHTYSWVKAAGGNRVSRESELRPSSLQWFQLPSNGIATECVGFGVSEREMLPLGEQGENVAAFLDHLLRADLNRFLSFSEALSTHVPGLDKLLIETPSADKRRVDFVIDDGFQIEAARSSVGVRLLLFFLSLAFHPNPPDVILLEEPENGIHPRRLAEVMDLLRKLTKGELGGHPAQVILTTHSPYLLDLVDLETDQVLVFQREDDGSRSVQPANKERIQEFFDGFMLGEVWYNAQEAGLVGEATP